MLSADLWRVPTEATEAELKRQTAEASGDVRAVVDALHATHTISAGPLNAGRRLALADRVEQLCMGKTSTTSGARSLMAPSCHKSGDEPT